MSNLSLKVKKWWWENAWELKKSPKNVLEDFNKNQAQTVVVSAIRSPNFNTTDQLIKLAWLLLDWDYELWHEKIEKIKKFHISLLKQKLWNNTSLEKKIEDYFDDHLLKYLKSWIYKDDSSKIQPNKNNDYSIWFWDKTISIIWFWENLSAFIHAELINELNVDWLESKNVDLQGVSDWLDNLGNDIFLGLSQKIREKILLLLNSNKIPIIPWYIPGFKDWIENTIGRWYSDATASMTSIWLSSFYDVTLEIQKSVEGMLSVDPRLLITWDPKLIEQIDYTTAKEITWIRGSQAKLLHSQVLRKELLSAGIEIKLFDPFDDSKWTIISKNKNPNSSWVEYIWARDNVIFFSISSWNMSDSWVLFSIFETVKSYGISVDIVSTSETEVSFTIDNNIEDKILDKLSNDIKEKLNIAQEDEMNFVHYNRNKALIFCVWQNLSHSLWSLARASESLKKWWINIELMSQGSMERSMIFGISGEQMVDAVNLLHYEFIEKKDSSNEYSRGNWYC